MADHMSDDVQPALETAPLRLCGYCKSWNSKPCGEGCCWSPTDPTIEKVRADDLKAKQKHNRKHPLPLPLKGSPMSIEAMRKALNYIENTEGEFGIKLSCGDALRDALASQPPAAPVETKPFYGAQCPTYPNCSGGCGLGCTHEVKQHQSCSAGSEPVAWMCEKAIWETVETQRIGGRWLRYLTFDRPAEAEYTRNITPLYSVSPQPMSVTEVLREVAEPLARTLIRCQTVLGNMAEENEGPGVFFFNRWPINHEPLRADAKNLVPIVSQALSAYHAAFMKIEREAASALSRPHGECGE